MIHVAYKHLDTKLKIAELTIWQWLGVLLGLGVGLGWGMYISPFGSSLTMVTSIYVGALPVGAAILASVSEFDLWLLLRSMLAWRRRDGRYAPGPGGAARGYLVTEGADAERTRSAHDVPELDLSALWEDNR